MLAKNQTSYLQKLILNGDLSLRKNRKNKPDTDIDIDFPCLTFDFLRQYTCEIYKIKQSSIYAKAHLYDNDDEFEFQVSSSYDSTLRCRLHSKHSSTTLYHLLIQFDNDDIDGPIKDHYCQCKLGARKLGCYSNIA